MAVVNAQLRLTDDNLNLAFDTVTAQVLNEPHVVCNTMLDGVNYQVFQTVHLL